MRRVIGHVVVEETLEVVQRPMVVLWTANDVVLDWER